MSDHCWGSLDVSERWKGFQGEGEGRGDGPYGTDPAVGLLPLFTRIRRRKTCWRPALPSTRCEAWSAATEFRLCFHLLRFQARSPQPSSCFFGLHVLKGSALDTRFMHTQICLKKVPEEIQFWNMASQLSGPPDCSTYLLTLFSHCWQAQGIFSNVSKRGLARPAVQSVQSARRFFHWHFARQERAFGGD